MLGAIKYILLQESNFFYSKKKVSEKKKTVLEKFSFDGYIIVNEPLIFKIKLETHSTN